MAVDKQRALVKSEVRRFWIYAIPLVVGSAAFAWPGVSHFLGPVAVTPETVQLGLQDNSKLILSEMTIGNEGHKPLILSNFRGSCSSCITFGLPSDAGLTDVDTLTIPPGDSVTLSVRLTIHGGPNAPFRAGITCATNDPRHPQMSTVFEASVRGWIFALPPELDLGILKPGQKVRHTVELRDSGRGEPCDFGRLQSPAPQCVKLTLSPASNSSSGKSGPGPVDKLVATLEVDIVAPSTPWDLKDRIAVYEANEDQPLLTIPIRGRVLPKVQVTPGSLILPRIVRDADDFSAECTFASTEGLPLRVAPNDVPPEITVTLLSGNAAKDRVSYRLEWRSERRPRRGQSRLVTVRFRAEVDGSVEMIAVPVRCRVD